MFEACLEMRNIAAQNHRSSLREPHEQRLVAGRVAGRGEQHEAPVAKDLVVAADELYRMLWVKATVSCRLPAHSYSTLCTSIGVLGNISMFPAWSGWLCDTASV